MTFFHIAIRFFAIIGFFGIITIFMDEMTMDSMWAIIQIAFWLSATIIGVEYLAKKFYTK